MDTESIGEYSVRCIREWGDFVRLKPEWNELAALHPWGAYLSHDWFLQWWKSFGQDQFLICQIYNRHQTLGIIPLRRGWRRGARRLALMANEHTPRMDCLCRPEAARSVLGCMYRHLTRHHAWDVFDLAQLPRRSAHLFCIMAGEAGLHSYRLSSRQQRGVDLDRPWADVEAGFHLSLRHNLRRRLRLLRSLGRLSLVVQTGCSGLYAMLRECFAVEASGWKGRAHTAIGQNPAVERFYRRMAFRLAASGQLRLYGLRLGEKLIAFEFCLWNGNRLGCLKIGYEESLHRFSPGSVLRAWMLQLAHRQGCAGYDFLGDDTVWKAEWGQSVDELMCVRLYNRTLAGRALQMRGERQQGAAFAAAQAAAGEAGQNGRGAAEGAAGGMLIAFGSRQVEHPEPLNTAEAEDLVSTEVNHR